MMTDETTTEQLAEIEGQGEPVQVREGRWRTRSGEVKNIRPCEPLKGAYYVWPWTDGFMTFQDNGLHQGSKESPNDLVKYLGPIEQNPQPEPQPEPVQVPEPQPQPQPEPEPVKVREGRWKTRGGLEYRVSPMPTDHWDFAPEYPWWDGHVTTWRTDGRFSVHQNAMDLVEYLGPIEQQPEPVPVVQGGLVRDVTHLLEESGVLDSAKAEQQIEELRSEVSYVQRLLGESNRKVAQLEDLVGSLRAINEVQEKAFTAAGKENTALKNQLAAVKAELASVAADRQRLRVELDAAQQVPADSPELQQLRADLEQMTQDRDVYRHAHELLLNDVNATHARTKAMTVEAIAEWLEPIRLVDSAYLANATMQHLPQIMRHLTGLDSHAID